MDYLQATIIGIVEGVTEFLPISSTGHMIVVAELLGLPQDELITSFEVIIQLAAIFAVFAYYRQRIFVVVHLWQHLLIAFLPIAICGFIFADYIKMLFSVQVVAWAFIVGGIFFLIVEKWYGKEEDVARVQHLEGLSCTHAFTIGAMQVLALVPGTSRSGMTIMGGMLSGLSRRVSAEFSFLLALPVMGAVALYDGMRYYDMILSNHLGIFLWGFLVAFLVAYGSIIVLMRFLERFSFVIFGWYRIVFGAMLLLLFVYT